MRRLKHQPISCQHQHNISTKLIFFLTTQDLDKLFSIDQRIIWKGIFKKIEYLAKHQPKDMWQIDSWSKYEEKCASDLWHDAVGWVLDCELCGLCGSWFPCAESINYPCLAPCPQLGCGDLPQMRENDVTPTLDPICHQAVAATEGHHAQMIVIVEWL